MYGQPSGLTNYGVPQERSNEESPQTPQPPTPESAVPPAQPTIVIPTALPEPVPVGLSWNEVQTADGRVYYFNSETRESQWDKPDVLKSEDELLALQTDWREYKIWDGRSFFFNDKTKCSVWSPPPEVILARGEYDPTLQECSDFDRVNKSEADGRAEFHQLLVERGVNETHNFSEAMRLIENDVRFSALPSMQTKQLFFASYVSNLLKTRIHERRDEKRRLYIDAVLDWKEWKGMSESITFTQMESEFKSKSWFSAIDRVELIKLFHVFSTEFIEIEKLKKRKLQDALMHEMKNDILGRLSQFDLANQTVIDTIYRVYADMKPVLQFWAYLSDSLKLVVIKSCIAQRVREMRMAAANRLPMSRESRTKRKEKDAVKQIIGDFLRSKAQGSVVKRGQGLTLPTWGTDLEVFLQEKQVDTILAKTMFTEYVNDVKLGKDPLEGIH